MTAGSGRRFQFSNRWGIAESEAASRTRTACVAPRPREPRETGWPRSCRGRFADELPDLKDLSLQQKTAEANVRSPLFGRPTRTAE